MLQKVLSPIYFAREDTRTPFRFALVSMVVNAVIAIGLAPVIGYLAAACGTTLAGWAMLALLYRGARRIDGGVEPDARLTRVFPRILAAALIMGAVLYAAAWLLQDALATDGLRYAALAGLVALGALTYGAVVFGSGALTRADLRRFTSR